YRISAKTREIYDIAGAGDTVLATVTLALASGYGLKEAVQLSSEAAGIVVGKRGVVPINLDDLKSSLESTYGK
ncbi:MAG: PfkB family carbohydrate kinase, partial [Nanoarchaeota archaeon]